MAAKTRGSKRRETEGNESVLPEEKKAKEAREQVVDEEGVHFQAEKEALTRSLQQLKDERNLNYVSLSRLETEIENLKRQRDVCLEKEENLEDKVIVTQIKLDLVEQRMVQQNLPPLPKEIYFEVAKHVHESEALAFAMTCRASRDAMKEALKTRKNTVYTGKRGTMLLTTKTKHYREKEGVPVSRDWIKWAFSMKWRYAVESKYNEEKKGKLLTYVAGRGGFKDLLVWLKSEGCFLGSNACYGAAAGGHLKVLKYLKSEGVPFNKETTYWAAEGGHIDMLKYLKSEGVEFDSDTCADAAFGGYINVLKYLKSEGMSFDSHTCSGAAQGGHIEVLKYLKSEGVPFDSDTCYEAAYGGHIEILKWLRSEEFNCPWDIQECLDVAEVEGHDEVVSWIESFL